MPRRIGQNRTVASIIFLTPALTFLVIFFVVPVIQSFYFSLQTGMVFHHRLNL